MPEFYDATEIVNLIQTGNTSGTYRYISFAMQNDFSKTQTYAGINYLNYLESLGWKIYFQANAYYAYKEITSVGTQDIGITPFQRNTFDVLCIAGGGGGGGQHGGAGGAGGYILTTKQFDKSTISVTVGAGGMGAMSGQSTARGENGLNSRVEDVVAIGGGGGATYNGNTSGAPGGSGGGGAIGHTSANGFATMP